MLNGRERVDTRVGLDDAIADELARDPADLLTRWVIVAEFADSSGARYLSRDWEAGMTEWESVALAENFAVADWEE